jgi:anti-sigma factor RsiW
MRSCDTVSAGAFFPQANFEVPQEEMRQHRGQHVVMPAQVLAHFIVRHPQFSFRFLKTLFHRPPDAT